jgi:hypothetical protein
MHLTYRFITQMRGGLISMLYNKATEVALVDVDVASSLTLMSADVERIVTGMQTGHEVRYILSLSCFIHPGLLGSSTGHLLDCNKTSTMNTPSTVIIRSSADYVGL